LHERELSILFKMHEVEREKKMAEHLYYVSLKYTKTGDVILNLISRWERMIDKCMDILLKKAKKNKKISDIPTAPKAKELAIRQAYVKEPLVIQIMELYSLFRRIPQSEKLREHEFRKNVTLKIIDCGREVDANMEKLKEWNDLLLKFVDFVKKQKIK